MDLPQSYSVLVKKAADFQCSKRVVDENYGDDGQAAMLCLVCGAILCTNSYCCQVEIDIEDEEDKLRIGGFNQHAQRLLLTCMLIILFFSVVISLSDVVLALEWQYGF